MFRVIFTHLRAAWLTLVIIAPAASSADDPVHISQQTTRLGPSELAVIVNDADPVSVKTAQYYSSRRRIPKANVIHVKFTPGRAALTRLEFAEIKQKVDAATPKGVQAYALAWSLPYRVDCMSITTAFALGFDEDYCSRACGPTKPSRYFNSSSHKPYAELGLRPTMALAGKNIEEVKKLIDRGIASDRTFPAGTGYLVSTSDAGRNVRAAIYPDIIQQYWGGPGTCGWSRLILLKTKPRSSSISPASNKSAR